MDPDKKKEKKIEPGTSYAMGNLSEKKKTEDIARP